MANPGLSVTLRGAEELRLRMLGFPQKKRAAIMRGGVGAALSSLRKTLRPRVPERSGKLRRAIRASTRSFDGGITTVGRLRLGNKDAWYAHIVEGGAQAHVIRGRRNNASGKRKALALKGVGVYASVKHPGFRGRHMVADAVQAGAVAAQSAFEQYVQTRIVRYLEQGT